MARDSRASAAIKHTVPLSGVFNGRHFWFGLEGNIVNFVFSSYSWLAAIEVTWNIPLQ